MKKTTNLKANPANLKLTNEFLAEAVRLKQYDMVELYLKLGANINVNDTYGNNLLFVAVFNQDKKMVNLLLDHGIEKNTPNKRNISVLEYAKGKNYKELAAMIENHQYKKLINDADLDEISIIESEQKRTKSKPSKLFLIKTHLLGDDLMNPDSPSALLDREIRVLSGEEAPSQDLLADPFMKTVLQLASL